MAAPDQAEVIPLIRLQDGQAPYKGVWSLEQTQWGHVEASHCTISHGRGPNCIIENRQFEGRDAARRFVVHLVVHGWGVLELQPEGESLIYPAASC
jgi:hypothetical protein